MQSANAKTQTNSSSNDCSSPSNHTRNNSNSLFSYSSFVSVEWIQALENFLSSEWPDRIMYFFIILNLISLIVETIIRLPAGSSQPDDVVSLFNALSWFFTCVYVLELIVKVSLGGWQRYWSYLRNRFVCCLLLIFLLIFCFLFFFCGYRGFRLSFTHIASSFLRSFVF